MSLARLTEQKYALFTQFRIMLGFSLCFNICITRILGPYGALILETPGKDRLSFVRWRKAGIATGLSEGDVVHIRRIIMSFLL